MNLEILWGIIKRILLSGFVGLIIGLCLVTVGYFLWSTLAAAFVFIFSWAGITFYTAYWLSSIILVFGILGIIFASWLEGQPPEE